MRSSIKEARGQKRTQKHPSDPMTSEPRRDEALTSLLGTVRAVTSSDSQSCSFHESCHRENGCIQNSSPSNLPTETIKSEGEEEMDQTIDRLWCGGEFESVDPEALRQFVEPIWNDLVNINAEKMLALRRVDVGARLKHSINVRSIHDEISPPKHEYSHASCVRYLHIAEEERKYSMGVFVFPPHARMPLHDHPKMCVLSRVLYGDLTKKSLDLENQMVSRQSWLSSIFSSHGKAPANSKRAYKRETEFLQAPDVTMLFPYKGNLHEFVAGPHGAAVLDVLIPPYDESRDCTFYKIQDDEHHPHACWIIPTGQPQDFHCISGNYRYLCSEDDEIE